jgi:hypothetical protein
MNSQRERARNEETLATQWTPNTQNANPKPILLLRLTQLPTDRN